MPVVGNDFTLIVSGSEDGKKLAFAHSKSCSLSFSNGLVDATLNDSNGWRQVISGKKSASINFDGLLDYDTITNRYNITDLTDFFLGDTLLYFNIGVGEDAIVGTGRVDEISSNTTADDVTSYSGKMTITGTLEVGVEVTLVPLQDNTGENITDDAGDVILVKTIN